MILSEAITHLEELKNNGTLKKVGGALEFSNIDQQVPTPAAFVVPERERAGANKFSNGFSQDVVDRFSVILVFKVVNDRSGLKAEKEVQSVRKAVKAQLRGWQPTEEYEPTEFEGGSLLKLGNGKLVWQDSFKTSIEERG